MANVTFSSPSLSRDVTVYAIAGDRGTILAVAKEHKIPIPFDCQDGECGSCLIEVTHLEPKVKYGIALTEKEKEALRQLGKITKQEIYDAEVNDMPPRYRLACQCFVRNEDIIVRFAGDETIPPQGPHITHAAARYKGGIEINTVDEFLSYAVKVEEEAASHFEQIAANMDAHANTEIATLFRQLGGFSRRHLAEAKARAKALNAQVEVPAVYAWPDNDTPEKASVWAGDAAMTRLDALKAALQGETRGYEFYVSIAAKVKNPEVAALAKEFVKEEAQHVRVLEALITREEWGQKTADLEAKA